MAARRDANNKKKRAGRLVLAKKVGPAVDVDDDDEENVDNADPGVIVQDDEGVDGHAVAGHASATVIPEEPMAAALAVPDESLAVEARPDGPPVVEEFTQGGAIQGT